MKKILLTGHTKGIGYELLKLLLSSNYEVLAIARGEVTINSPNLKQLSCNFGKLQDVKKLQTTLSDLLFDVVILNAGYNTIKPAEAYTLNEIEHIINVNFTSATLITRMCLPGLIKTKGHIVGIGSFSGIEVGKWNNYYGSSKAALHHFLKNIFEQYRKQGIRVTNIIPDITASSFYDHQDFEPSSSPDAFIDPRAVAELIFNVINDPHHYIPVEIVVRPQRFELKRKLKK
jgi:hypothetical protein